LPNETSIVLLIARKPGLPGGQNAGYDLQKAPPQPMANISKSFTRQNQRQMLNHGIGKLRLNDGCKAARP